MNEYEFHYPPNLKSKPTILFWEVRDLSVIVVGAMVSFYFMLSKGFVIPCVISVTYAIMTTRVNEYTILNGFINYFLLDKQEYDWDYVIPAADKKQTVRKRPATKERQKKKISNVDEAVRKKKRDSLIRMSFAAIALILTAGAGFWFFFNEKKQASEKKLLDTIYITFAETDVIEYGLDPVDAKSMITASYGNISAEPEIIYPSTLGRITIEYSVSDITEYGKEVVKKYQKEYQIEDTQVPVVEIGSETVVLNAGQKYDVYSNIKQVFDPVDGELSKSDSLDYGTYMITGEADLDKPGTYPITVDACDKNGKNTTLIYFIEVRE